MTDEDGRPLQALRVEVHDEAGVLGPTRLGEACTDAAGRFVLPGPAPALARLVVRCALGLREVARAGPFPPDAQGALPDVRVPRARAEGWAVTLEEAAPARVTDGNDVRMLVDGEAFARIAEVVTAARTRVHLLQFAFRPAFTPRFPGPPLFATLETLAAGGVDVRVLLRRHAIAEDWFDETRAFWERHAPNVRLRAYPTRINTLHAKVVVVDDATAFVVGPPFEQRYWDTREHRVDEWRRENRLPFHDVSVEIRGPAVRDVAALFADLWNRRAPDDPVKLPAAPAAAGRARVQVLRTLPAGAPGAPEGERGVFEANLRALAAARRFAYFENQYLTSRGITDAVNAALEANPGLRVVLVSNEDVDVPTYAFQARRRLEDLGHDAHPRLGAFSLWSAGPGPDRPVLRRRYVHTKLAVADDAWATVGSANLDGISLEGAAELGMPTLLNLDLNVGVLDGVDGAEATGVVARLRRELWREHLGRDPGPDPLDDWRRAAHGNVRRLRDGEPMVGAALPFGLARELAEEGAVELRWS